MSELSKVVWINTVHILLLTTVFSFASIEKYFPFFPTLCIGCEPVTVGCNISAAYFRLMIEERLKLQRINRIQLSTDLAFREM